eukprot:scaffold98891_cov29-Tisochrysis_lutea.AAC.2
MKTCRQLGSITPLSHLCFCLHSATCAKGDSCKLHRTIRARDSAHKEEAPAGSPKRARLSARRS